MARPLVMTLALLPFCLAAAGVADARVHVIAGGETLQAIAQHEHVTVSDIARLNQLQGPLDGPLVAGTMLALDEEGVTALPAPTAVAPVEPANPLSLPLLDAASANAPGTLSGGNAVTPRWSGPSSMRRFAGRIMTRASKLAVRLTRSAMRFIGTPYVFGGTSPYGFDCSGYVQHVFAMLGIRLPRTADSQYYAGHTTGGRILAGDLVFFQTYEAGPSHVGIYLGKGRFVHASSSHGVEISSLRNGYWSSRYLGARRYVAASRLRSVMRTAAE